MTHHHYKPPPSICQKVFDTKIRRVPNVTVSRELAKDCVEWTNWLIQQLLIHNGRITVLQHEGAVAKIEYTVVANVTPINTENFTEAEARKELNDVIELIRSSGGRLTPDEVCNCLGTVFGLLLRLSDMKFGTLDITVRQNDAFDMKPTPRVMPGKRNAIRRLCKTLYGFLFL